MIASIIDSYVTQRDEFQLLSGYQPFDSLFYLIKGSFSCSFYGREELIREGEIVVFDKHTPMSRRAHEHISFLYIKFSAKNEGSFPIKSGVFRELSDRELFDLDKLTELSERRTKMSLALREHYLNDLLISLLLPVEGKCAATKAAELPSALDLPISYMRENLESKLSLGEIARAAGMSQSSLENKFRELMGRSAYEYLIELRIDRAKHLLTETSLPVSDIARRCGYENQFYFCNAFKKQMGLTPTEYRKI